MIAALSVPFGSWGIAGSSLDPKPRPFTFSFLTHPQLNPECPLLKHRANAFGCRTAGRAGGRAPDRSQKIQTGRVREPLPRPVAPGWPEPGWAVTTGTQPARGPTQDAPAPPHCCCRAGPHSIPMGELVAVPQSKPQRRNFNISSPRRRRNIRECETGLRWRPKWSHTSEGEPLHFNGGLNPWTIELPSTRGPLKPGHTLIKVGDQISVPDN